MIHSILEYLRNRQPAKIRYLHIAVLLLVISQIFVSNLIDFTNSGEISAKTLNFLGTWTHIITGITLLPIALVFAVLVIREHGFRYFYPYLFGDFNQLKSDVSNLLKFHLPEPEGGGLAAIIKGLGLGALFIALLSGLTWFCAWQANAPWADGIKILHAYLVGLIEVYVIGHGGIGLLHIYLTARRR